MPILYNLNAIFIHIPKTAGTSIETILFENINSNDYLKYWYGNVNNYELDHSTIKYLVENCKHYNKNFFKFCVVRNPYERLVSEYKYCKNYYSRFIKNINSFKEFIFELNSKFNQVLENEENNHHLISHYLPQYKFTHIDSKNSLDFIMKFENLEEDWIKLCENLKINKKLIKVDKYSSKKKYNYLDYYDDKLKEIVYQLYEKDFLLFGYEK